MKVENPILKTYIPVIKNLARILGNNCELVLHDISTPENSIIVCENCHISGRSVGGPLTDLGFRMLKDSQITNFAIEKQGNLYRYQGTTVDGRPLRCGTCLIKDDKEKIIGILCVNIDLNKVVNVKEIMKAFFDESSPSINDSVKSQERFSNDIEDVFETYLEQVSKRNIKPLHLLSKKERLEVLVELDEKGFFLLSGSIERIAKIMNKSRFTIYSNLKEAKEKIKIV